MILKKSGRLSTLDVPSNNLCFLNTKDVKKMKNEEESEGNTGFWNLRYKYLYMLWNNIFGTDFWSQSVLIDPYSKFFSTLTFMSSRLRVLFSLWQDSRLCLKLRSWADPELDTELLYGKWPELDQCAWLLNPCLLSINFDGWRWQPDGNTDPEIILIINTNNFCQLS